VRAVAPPSRRPHLESDRRLVCIAAAVRKPPRGGVCGGASLFDLDDVAEAERVDGEALVDEQALARARRGGQRRRGARAEQLRVVRARVEAHGALATRRRGGGVGAFDR